MTYSVTIHQLAEGNGESGLILIKKNKRVDKSILIDSGFKDRSQTIINTLNSHLDGTPLTAVVTTHYDSDHFRGISEVIRIRPDFINENTVFYDNGIPVDENGFTIDDVNGTVAYDLYKNCILNIALNKTISDVTNAITTHLTPRQHACFKQFYAGLLKIIFPVNDLIKLREILRSISDVDDGNRKEFQDHLESHLRRHKKGIKTCVTNQGELDDFVRFIASKIGDVLERFSDIVHNMWPSFTESSDWMIDKELLNYEDNDAPTLRCLSINRAGGFERNNKSICLYFKLGDFTFYTAGDLESSIEDEIMGKIDEKSVSLIKVSHHGSQYSTSNDFLNKLNPVTAFISCGNTNSHSHPEITLLERLNLCRSLQNVFLTETGCKEHSYIISENRKFIPAGDTFESDIPRNEPANIIAQYIQGQRYYIVVQETLDNIIGTYFQYPLQCDFVTNYGARLIVDYEKVSEIKGRTVSDSDTTMRPAPEYREPDHPDDKPTDPKDDGIQDDDRNEDPDYEAA